MAKISITTHPTIAHLLAILILMLAAGGSFCASAYTMPADKLLGMSNKQLCYKGYDFYLKSQRDSALICYNIVASRADKKQSREELDYACYAFATMANIFIIDFYDYERSMQCILKAEQIALKNNLNERLAHIYVSMASLEGSIKNIQQNFAFSHTVFELYRKTFHQSLKQENGQRYTALALINLITLALEHHKLDLILNELEMFQDMTINDTILECVYAKHQCSAALLIRHQQYDSALLELMELDVCLSMAEQDRPIYKAIAHENLFFAYRDMKDHDAALYELEQLETISEQSNIKFGVIEALLLKRDYYALLGNNALADKYDLEYHKAKDNYIADTKLAKADEEKVLFKLNEANHEIKELSYKQRIQHTELIAVAVVAVLLLALLALAWVNYRRTKQKNETLYQHNMQLMANEDRLRQLHQAEEEATSAPTVKYRRSNMEGDDITQVMEKVDRVMESSTEIFSADFSLDRLAELTGETRLRLSQAINKVPGRTFYSILNGYRVREACRRMDDKAKYSGLTIEAIGQSVGFKNRSSFVAIFKRITGVTPSAYFKQSTEPNSPTSEPQAD